LGGNLFREGGDDPEAVHPFEEPRVVRVEEIGIWSRMRTDGRLKSKAD
jgi:hypothetical protein